MKFARHRIMAGICVAGALALAAGCSTDSDDPPAGTTGTNGGAAGLTAAEYRQQANAVCVETEAGIAGLENPPNATPQQIADILGDGLEIQQKGIDRLKALDPPDDLQAGHDRAMRLLDQRQSVTQELLERIEGGENVNALTREYQPRIQRLRDQGDDAARELGLEECVDGPSSSGASGDASGGGSALNRYRADVRAAGAAIGNFARLLQNNESFAAKEDRLRANLDAFDKNIRDLNGYKLSNAQLERQRAGLAKTGPDVTEVLNRFMEAAARNDEGAIRDLAPEVQEVLGDFQAVVTQSG